MHDHQDLVLRGLDMLVSKELKIAWETENEQEGS